MSDTQDKALPNNPVACQACGAEIGKYIQAGDHVYLLIGNAILRDAWGWCNDCREEWNWHESDQRFEKLISRLIDRG